MKKEKEMISFEASCCVTMRHGPIIMALILQPSLSVDISRRIPFLDLLCRLHSRLFKSCLAFDNKIDWNDATSLQKAQPAQWACAQYCIQDACHRRLLPP